MSKVRIVVIGPKFEGNAGAIARSMANFNFEELYFVNPCKFGDDAYRRSKHGSYILKNAKIVDKLDEAIEDCFIVAGTSGVISKNDRNYARIPITVREFAQRYYEYPEKIAIVFGKEDTGLLQQELDICDILITIPSSDKYPVLNLSHAASIVMYELFQLGNIAYGPRPANRCEKELMFKFFWDFMDAIDYPKHRRNTTQVMFRRMIGRAIPTKYEYNTIMGVFGDGTKIIKSTKAYNKKVE